MKRVRRLDISDPRTIPADSGDAIGVVSSREPFQVVELVRSSPLQHIVQSDGPRFESECRTAETMLTDPGHFLSHPLDAILGPGVQARTQFSITVEASAKKSGPLSEFNKYLLALDESTTLNETALMAADELYTNASKNAWPADGALFQGPAVNAGTIDFFAAADDEVLAIGCRDSFGLLDIRTALGRIKTCYEQGVADSIRWGSGGAGIGSFMVFDASLSYYAAVDQGRTSLICITLPLRRRLGGAPKNIHLLSLPKI